MYSIHKEGKDSFVEQKSEFIGWGMPVETEEEALAYIDTIKSLHPKASHNCYAYILGEDRNTQRFSDDGEPSGTAGIPMLEVLKKQEVTNVCVVATRYFGGILLGKGGLARAYTRCAVIALEAGKIVEKINALRLRITIPYEVLGTVDYSLRKEGRLELDRKYGEAVSITLLIPEKEKEIFVAGMEEILSGKLEYRLLGEESVSYEKGKILL